MEDFIKELNEMNLEQVIERKSQLETEIRSAENTENLEGMEEKINAINERIADLKDLELRKAQAAALNNGTAQPDNTIDSRKGVNNMEQRTFAVDSVEYRDAYLKNLMGRELDAEERAAISASKVIPTETLNKIVAKLEDAPLLNRITILQIKGNVSIPYEKTTNDANWVAMATAATDSADALDAVALGAYKLIKTIEIGADVEAMSISAFESFIVESLSRKMRVALQAAVINGTGSSQPTGVTKAGAVTSQAKTYTKAGITYADILSIMAELKAGYHANANWTIPSATFFGEVLGLVDSNKRPIVVQNVQAGAGYMLMGHPVDLVDVAADTITFGDYSRYYMNLGENVDISADKSVAFRAGSTVYRAMALCDGAPVDKDAIVVAKKSTT